MNLYDFIDNWEQSYWNPKTYSGEFSKEDLISGIRFFSAVWLKELISDELFDSALAACKKCIDFEKSGVDWKDSSFAHDYKDIDMGAAVFEGYSLNSNEEEIAKEMLHSGVHIISDKQASEIFDSKDDSGHYHSSAAYLLHIDKKSDDSICFVAIDNQSGDAWTEDFASIEGARAWFNGVPLEEAQNYGSDKKTDITLEKCFDSKNWQDLETIAKNIGLEISDFQGDGDRMTAVTAISQPQMEYFKEFKVEVDFKRGDIEDFAKSVKDCYNLYGPDETVKTALQTDEDAWNFQLEDLLKEAEITIEVYEKTAERFADAVSKALNSEKSKSSASR